MKQENIKLIRNQIDQKLKKYEALKLDEIPYGGWVFSFRIAVGMSLRQLGNRLGISTNSARFIEVREKSGAITIKALKRVAEVFDMEFFYGFIPRSKTLDEIVEKKAIDVARDIVMRTSQSMNLEDQKNMNSRLERAIEERAKKIKEELPRYLWD